MQFIFMLIKVFIFQNGDAKAIRSEIEDAMADKYALFKVQVKADMKKRTFDTYNVLRMAVDKGYADKGKAKVVETEVIKIMLTLHIALHFPINIEI